MPTVKNSEAVAVLSAHNEIATRRYDDTVFRVHIAENRRALREQLKLISPIEEELRVEYALLDDKGQAVLEGPDEQKIPKIDPLKLKEFNKKINELGEQTFELPHSFTAEDMEKGKEKLEGEKGGYKLISWACEPWLYDALVPVFNSAKPELVED